MSVRSEKEPAELDAEARQLALVDRIIGLEAELANIKIGEPNALRFDIEALKASATWRVGRVVLAPARFARRAFRAVLKR